MSEIREELKEINIRSTADRELEETLGIDGWTKWAELIKKGQIADAVVNFAYNLGPGMNKGELKSYFKPFMGVNGDHAVKMKDDNGEMKDLVTDFNWLLGDCVLPWYDMSEELGKAIEKCLEEEWLFFDKGSGQLLTKEVRDAEERTKEHNKKMADEAMIREKKMMSVTTDKEYLRGRIILDPENHYSNGYKCSFCNKVYEGNKGKGLLLELFIGELEKKGVVIAVCGDCWGRGDMLESMEFNILGKFEFVGLGLK
jgi:hypothetical protein